MTWLFVGPVPLSGIGQVMFKYAQLFGAEYVTFHETPKKEYKHVFAFIIPQVETFGFILKKFNPTIVMTVCETEPVHENYGMIFKTFPRVLVPSQFCKDVFTRQFPDSNIEVFPHWPGPVSLLREKNDEPYTFYTIGNIIDPRKNIKMILEAFIRCRFPNARLVLKATCKSDVHMKLPNVTVINGLLTDKEMDDVHEMCHCYVNCSHSEGVGMGAVEAAIRNKPVIITDFGGLKEYVKTPFIIECTETSVGVTDFLFEPHMKWGKPSLERLMTHMNYCYENNVRTWDHSHTREFTDSGVLRTKFSNLSLALTGSPVEILGTTDDDGGDRGSGDEDDWVRL